MMRPLAALLATALVAPSRCFEVPGAVAALGAKYADSMAARPLLTKMGTSAAIFGASDASAQALERAPALDRTRLAVTTAIGGFYSRRRRTSGTARSRRPSPPTTCGRS
ncbi:hypothetical protein JL720_13 [Aureococcus anophagefferens]|nr:hypothetical protein JL720_13 [Aureococcus anophagefferens]